MTDSPLEITQNENALYNAFKAVQRTHEEVAALFRSLDRGLEEKGYIKDGKDAQFDFSVSKKYREARKFCPTEFSNDYLLKNDRKICLYVSACPFGDEDEDPPLDQIPHISCELYLYRKPIREGTASKADTGDEEGYEESVVIPKDIFLQNEYGPESKSLKVFKQYIIRMLALRTPQDIQRMIIEPVTIMTEARDVDKIVKKLKEFADALLPVPLK